MSITYSGKDKLFQKQTAYLDILYQGIIPPSLQNVLAPKEHKSNVVISLAQSTSGHK